MDKPQRNNLSTDHNTIEVCSTSHNAQSAGDEFRHEILRREKTSQGLRIFLLKTRYCSFASKEKMWIKVC
ncbi:MAG: hypothetical protein P8075_06445, partial [Deltaproteobacteria bacterium]